MMMSGISSSVQDANTFGFTVHGGVAVPAACVQSTFEQALLMVRS